MQNAKPEITIPFWAPMLLGIAYLFAGLNHYGLLNNQEGLYAEIAREMLEGGNYLIPHLNGQPYLEKPPLFYYLLAASFRVFGVSEVAARSVSAVAGMACLAGLMWFGTRIGKGQAGRLAALILISSLGYIIMSRVVMPDMLLTAFLNLSLFAAYLALREGNRTILRASYLFLALAVMTKGLVALALYGLIVVGFVLVAYRHEFASRLRFLSDGWGLLLFVLITAPWHILASLGNADFAWFYFINEHVLRFLGLREPHDYYGGSVWYYLPRILLFLIPWPAYLFLVRYRRDEARQGQRTEIDQFLWLAWLVPLVFFSASLAKANYYMIVAMPPLAMLIALRIEELAASRRFRPLALPVAAVLFGLLVVGTRYWLRSKGLLPGIPVAAGPMAKSVAIVSFLAIGAAALVLMKKERYAAAFFAVALMSAPFLGFFLNRAEGRDPYVSSRALARFIDSACGRCEVYIYKDFEKISALRFYLGHSVAIIDSESSDLRFGQRHGKGAGTFLDTPSFLNGLGAGTAAVVVHDSRIAQFRQSPLADRLKPIRKIGHVTVFSDRPWSVPSGP